MDPKPYSNREIDEFLHDLRNSLMRIEVQTTTTNGRVGKLENWRWFITGGLGVIVVLLLPILFILIQHIL